MIDALLAIVPHDREATTIPIQPDSASPAPQGELRALDNYNPALVFVLEFATGLVLQDDDTVMSFGRKVVEALQMILRDASQHHVVTVSRAAFYLFSVLRASYVCIPNATSNMD